MPSTKHKHVLMALDFAILMAEDELEETSQEK
jgi:hypothetical protein